MNKLLIHHYRAFLKEYEELIRRHHIYIGTEDMLFLVDVNERHRNKTTEEVIEEHIKELDDAIQYAIR